jgi:hypothetical protein
MKALELEIKHCLLLLDVCNAIQQSFSAIKTRTQLSRKEMRQLFRPRYDPSSV